QVRNMIRHESVVTALIGAALGIPVGVGLGALVGHAIQYPAFTVPWGTLVVFVFAAIVAGIIAAIFPARRAGRLNVLDPLQYERSDPDGRRAGDRVAGEHHPLRLDAEELAVFEARDDAPAVVALAAEDRRNVPVRGVAELRLEPPFAPAEDDLVALHEPAAEERHDVVRRRVLDLPGLRRDRPL